jgi:hypothetical protein
MSEYATMAAAERELTAVVNKLNRMSCPQRLVIFAVLRLLRKLLRQLPEAQQAMVINELAIPFLRNEPVEEKLVSIN